MKKFVSILLSIIMVLTLAVGCGNSEETNPSSENSGVSSNNESESAKSADEKKVLKMAHHIEIDNEEKPYDFGMSKILSKFTEQTGIEIELEVIPWDQMESKLVITNQSGEPSGDIFALSSQKLASVVNAGALMPLDDRIAADFNKDDFNDVVFPSGTYLGDGKIYIVLQSVHGRGIYYNKDYVSTPPTTWDELIEIGKEISKPEEGLYAFGFWGGKHYGSIENILGPAIWSTGAKITNDDGSAAWNTPEVAESVKFLSDCVNIHQISPESCFTITDYDEMAESFRAGNIAMISDGTYGYAPYFESELGKAGKIGFAPYPGKDGPAPNFSNGWAWGIPSNAKQPDLAWEFIKFFETKEIQIEHSKIEGGLPTLKACYENESFTKFPFPDYIDNLANYGRSMDPFVYFQEGMESLAIAAGAYCLDPSSDVTKLLEESATSFNKKYYNK